MADIHSLFNFRINDKRPGGGLRPTSSDKPATASAFITPQSLAAFPLSSGIVAAFWKAAQGLWPKADTALNGSSHWVCLCIAVFIAATNFIVSITDPALNTTRRERLIGVLFTAINAVYLFVTAVGIDSSITNTP